MEKGDRIELLLTFILLHQMKSAPQKDKVLVLNQVGYTNVEIANILEITSDKVAKSLYQARSPGSVKAK